MKLIPTHDDGDDDDSRERVTLRENAGLDCFKADVLSK